MVWDSLNLMPALPEIVLLAALSFVLIFDLFISDQKRGVTAGLTLLTLAGVAVLQALTFEPYSVTTFSDMFIRDPFADLIKYAMYAAMAMTLIYSRSYIEEREMFKGEFYTLSLFALLGMNVMVSANHFLTLYIGLELLSLALYALIALRRDSVTATEAAMKYFVLGALASGLLLYGMSMVYGATGSLYIGVVAKMLMAGQFNAVLMVLGIVFLVAGLAFKLGVVPFHMWVPDVYQGSPTAVTLLLGAAPKLAAFAFILRIMVQGLQGAMPVWQGMFAILAILSLLIGNLSALVQNNVKRMLAYSTISHMGFVALGLMAGTSLGYSSAFYYIVIYVLMSLVAFGVLIGLSAKGIECETLDDLKGLNAHNSWYAFLMLLAMFSMAGIPPLAGFYAKFTILRAVLDVGVISIGGLMVNSVWIVVFAVMMSLVGAFYYLRVVKAMYFDEAKAEFNVQKRSDMTWVLSGNALLLLVLGLVPEHLLAMCFEAMKQSLAMF